MILTLVFLLLLVRGFCRVVPRVPVTCDKPLSLYPHAVFPYYYPPYQKAILGFLKTDLPQSFSMAFVHSLANVSSAFSYTPISQPKSCIRVKEHWKIFDTPPCPTQPGCGNLREYDPTETWFTSAHICDSQFYNPLPAKPIVSGFLSTLQSFGFEPFLFNGKPLYTQGKLSGKEVVIHPLATALYLVELHPEKFLLITNLCHKLTKDKLFSDQVVDKLKTFSRYYTLDPRSCARVLNYRDLNSFLGNLVPTLIRGGLPVGELMSIYYKKSVPDGRDIFYYTAEFVTCESSERPVRHVKNLTCLFHPDGTICDYVIPAPYLVKFKVEEKPSFLSAFFDEILHFLFNVLKPLLEEIIVIFDLLVIKLLTWIITLLLTLFDTTLFSSLVPFIVLLILTRTYFPNVPHNPFTICIAFCLYCTFNNIDIPKN